MIMPFVAIMMVIAGFCSSSSSSMLTTTASAFVHPSRSISRIVSLLPTTTTGTCSSPLSPVASFLQQQQEHNVGRRDVNVGGSSSTTQLYFFNKLFGSDVGGGGGDETPNEGELAKYSRLPVDKFEVLGEYIQQWAESQFVKGTSGGSFTKLTTPVKIVRTDDSSSSNVDASTTMMRGVKILFQPIKSTYKSKKEEGEEEGEGESEQDDKSKDGKRKLEGGVEVFAEQLEDMVVIRARRTEMDEDTMIKEMSEETILKELKIAIDVWKKDNNL